MAEKDGVSIPFSVEADGADITIEKLAAAVLDLTAKVDGLNKTAKGIQGAVRFSAFADGVKLVKDAFAGVKGVFGDFSAEMERATGFGTKFHNMALQYNTSAESLQKLAIAGKPAGVSIEQIARSMNLLDRQMGKMGPVFKKYGLDMKDIAGKDNAERFNTIIGKIGQMKSPADQAAASFALLKDRTGSFLKLARDPEGFARMQKDIEDFGLAVNDNAVGALSALGDKREMIEQIGTSLKTNFLGGVASSGAFQEAIRIVTEYMGKLSKWVKDNQATIQEWTSKGILIAIDALSFLATKVIPKAIDAWTGMRVALAGVQYLFESLSDSAIFLYDTLSNPTAIGKNLATLKAATAETNKRFDERVADAMKQNAQIQEGAKVIGDTLKTVRDRIEAAAHTQGQFAAKLTETGNAAGLSAEQIDKLKEATKAWEEKMADVARTTATGFAELADKVLPETEQKVNSLMRATAEQQRKLQEDFAKENEKLAKQGLPSISGASLAKNLDETAKLLSAKLKDVYDSEAKAGEEAWKQRIQAMTDSIIGNFGKVQEKASELRVALAKILTKGDTSIEIGTPELQGLSDAALEATIAKWREIAQEAQKAGKPAEEYFRKLHAAEAALLANAGNQEKVTKAVEEQVISMRMAEATEKKQHDTLKEVLAIKVKAKEITQEEADKLLPKAVTNAELFRDALELAAQAAELLGHGLGDIIGGMLSAAAAGEQVAASIKEARKNGEGMGKALLGAAGAGLSVAANIYNANKKNLSGTAGAMSGAAQGASFGAAFGPWGAAIGGLAGGLIGFFSGSKFRKIAKDAGKVLGEGLSKETVSKIEEDAKKLGLTTSKAALLSISEAMADTNKKASEYGTQVGDLMKAIADGSVPAKEGLAEVGEMFTAIADEALKAGRVGDRTMTNLIKQARALKIESPEMKAFVAEQLDSALEGVHKFVAAINTLSDEAIGKLGKDSGIVFGAMFDALVSERGIVAAVDALKDDFGSLREKLDKALGTEAMEKILGPFGAAFATLGDEKLRPIFEGIDGLTQAMKGLANAGFLTTDQFTAMQDATATLFDEAIAGGADMKTALLAVAPGIQAAISAAEQFGVPLDADTQRLKDLAEQNGITFKTDPQAAMLDVLVAIAEVLGADIPESAKRAQKSLEDLKNATPGEVNVGGGGPSGGTEGPKNVQANVTVNMGINENPLAAADTAAAMRRMTVEWTADAIQDRIPGIVASIEEALA